MITIGNNSLTITLHAPDGADGYYRGTRFDWAGVFGSIEYRGCNYSEPWFEQYSPLMHDAVCGPAEEFSPVGWDEVAVGETFLKIGVGVLKKMEGPYDRFKLHDIVDPGVRTVYATADSVVFDHVVSMESGYGYDYTKEIALTGDVYNHNFFTMGLMETGPSRQLDFPFRPEGDWRAEYSEVGFTDSGIRFTRVLQKGESVYTGNLHEVGRGLTGSPNGFTLSELQTGRSVKAECALPMTKSVFWSNYRISCIEPYSDFRVLPGETFEFDIDYTLSFRA